MDDFKLVHLDHLSQHLIHQVKLVDDLAPFRDLEKLALTYVPPDLIRGFLNSGRMVLRGAPYLNFKFKWGKIM